MNEQDLRTMIEEVRAGRMARRAFVKRLAVFGVTAPMATQLLMHSGAAVAQTGSSFRRPSMATKRGGGGAL